jgi:hypothetical protein
LGENVISVDDERRREDAHLKFRKFIILVVLLFVVSFCT